MKHVLLLTVLLITACEGYHMPSVRSDNPASMTSEKLCYQAAITKNNPEIATEINRRHLNCRNILDNDPILNPK